jgi:orotidine-5'-phosphate decarboxylase
MTALEKLLNAINQGKHICVGLDSDIQKIPQHLIKNSNPISEFNKIIIESTLDFAAAYKINFAFYEKDGIKGYENIYKILEQLKSENILLIADAKRGDIGNTSQMYAQAIYDNMGFDSITVHPYMGFDSLEPFLSYEKKLNFILTLTSNPGSKDFEKMKLESGEYLFQKIINEVNKWNVSGNCGIVFGATNIEELRENISLFPKLPVLLPGVGSQGGSLEEVVKVFTASNKSDFLINVSRALIYCNSSKEFGSFINEEIKRLNNAVSKLI